MRDPEIRTALARDLRRSRALTGSSVAVQELGLCRGAALLDVALVNGRIHGFEIKSDYDTLRRLEGQVRTYGLVLDRATLVVGRQHLTKARAFLPSWWGLAAVDVVNNEPVLNSIRKARDNPSRDARAIAELLWLDEARGLLERRDALRGLRNKPRPAVWDRVAEVYTLDEIAASVRVRLKARAAAGLLRRLS